MKILKKPYIFFLIICLVTILLSILYYLNYSRIAIINSNWNIKAPLSFNSEIVYSDKGEFHGDGIDLIKVNYREKDINKIKNSFTWNNDSSSFYNEAVKLDNSIAEDKNLSNLLKIIENKNSNLKYCILTPKEKFLIILLIENSNEVYFFSNSL